MPEELDFLKEDEIFIEQIKWKLKSNRGITTEDVEKLKAQCIAEEWQGMFEPFKSSFKHKALDNFRQTCITLFATDKAPGHLLSIKIERESGLLPCKTDEDAQKALAWLAEALSAASQNPLVLGGKRFPLELEHAHAAFKKPEVSEGLGLILEQLGCAPGMFELYDPEEPR